MWKLRLNTYFVLKGSPKRLADGRSDAFGYEKIKYKFFELHVQFIQ